MRRATDNWRNTDTLARHHSIVPGGEATTVLAAAAPAGAAATSVLPRTTVAPSAKEKAAPGLRVTDSSSAPSSSRMTR